MRDWGFWEWLTYISLGIAALVLATDQALKGSPTMTDRFSGILGSSIWNYAPLFFIGMSGVLLLANQLGWTGAHKTGVESVAPSSEPAIFIRTSLRLQFFGDYRIPQEISSENVATWFAYYSPSLTMTPHDADGKPMPGGFEIPPTWAIFITIDKPTAYRQAIPTFSNPDVMPPTEVRMATTRSMVVSSRSQIPAGVLEIHVEK